MTQKAKQSFARSDKDGNVIVVSEDDFYADDHPYVKAWPEMFGDLLDQVHVHTAEQATAAPGETRKATRRH